MHALSFPATRRRFLSWAATAGGILTLQPASLLGTESRRRLAFILVSDTHLGHQDQQAAVRQWGQMATEMAQAEGDLVLHLGDIVDGGREEQYPVYLKVRQQIGKPVHEIPGNHDPAELFARHIRSPIDAVVDHHWLRFLLLNNSRTDSHDGFLSDGQIEWIDRHCRDAAQADMKVAVCMHVAAHDNKHPDRGWHVKPEHGQTKLYETLARHKSTVVALFHGHFHNGLRGWNDRGGLHEVCFPSALYNRDRKLEEQNAPGYNPLEFRAGFTLAALENGRLTLRFKPLGGEMSVTKELTL